MNESEIRRRELLRQTRKLYDEKKEVPAVHPRYGSLYRSLYDDPAGNGQSPQSGGSFLIRLVIGILCFAGFVWMDHNSTEIAHIDSTVIINQIEKELTP